MAFQKEPLRKNNKLTLADVPASDREYKGEKKNVTIVENHTFYYKDCIQLNL